MGLCYETNRWLDRLWSEHLELSSPARDLVKAGIKKQGESFAGFPSDLHARLYLQKDPELKAGSSWAMQLHLLASELGEWQRLQKMCARNGFAAGIATEVMLSQLLPLVPEPPPSSSSPDHGGDDDERGKPCDTDQEGSDKVERSDADIRAALRRATRRARDVVKQSETELDGLNTPLGFSHPGKGGSVDSGPANIRSIREAHSRLANSRRLQKISKLAGRLERIAASKARSRVRPGIGEMHGVNLGSDPSFLLPSELVMLRHPRLRLAFLSRLIQRKALCYGMQGKEPLAKGPIVVLLDESHSMQEHGKDIWSKAVSLALLSTATKQKRSWHLIAFNARLRREVEVSPGKVTFERIVEALDHRCTGGTDFDAPILRAVEIIKTSATMKSADVVIITDGEDELDQATVESANALTRTAGVSWYAVGVGPSAKEYLNSLSPIATSMVIVRDTDDPEPIVPVLNLECHLSNGGVK